MRDNKRYDFFLIWGHGLKYKDEIISLLEQEENIRIIRIIKHIPSSIKKLVKEVYSYDYAPFHHLKSKTNYLLKTPKEVMFIIVENIYPDEDWFGDGEFRHIESKKIKRIKETIRDIYNERKKDRRTENHIIHASDNEVQTNQILKYLGYFNGLEEIINFQNRIVKVPYHLGKNEFRIKEIEIDELYANIIIDEQGILEIKQLEETPHFKSLIYKNNEYQEYLNRFQGTYLTDYYSLNKLKKLDETLSYLGDKFENNYIVVKRNKEKKLIIMDGLHRAVIMKKRGIKKIIVAEVIDK